MTRNWRIGSRAVLALLLAFPLCGAAIPALAAEAPADKPEPPAPKMTAKELETACQSPDPQARIKALTANLPDEGDARAQMLELRASAYICAGQPDKAQADLDEIFKDKDKVPAATAFFLRGLARFSQGKYKEAAAEFERKIGADAPAPLSLVWAALCRMRTGEKPGAKLARLLRPDGDNTLKPGTPLGELVRLYTGKDAVDTYYDAVQAEAEKFGAPKPAGDGGDEDDGDDPVDDGGAVEEGGEVELPLDAPLIDDAVEVLPEPAEGFLRDPLPVLAAPPPVPAGRAHKPTAEELEALKKEHRRRKSAEAAFYIGEWHLARGQREDADKWLARAADYQGLPEPHAPIIGKGAVASQELAKLRAAAKPEGKTGK